MLPSALRRALLSSMALSMALVLTAPPATSQDATGLFQDGIDAYRTGDTAQAVELFKDALAADPGDEEIFRLWQQAEQRVILDMLQERGEMGALAERFLQRAKLGRAHVATDPGGAREVVARYLDGDPLESEKALLELQATYGEWAVPALVGPLGDLSNDDHRVMAIGALIHLGDVAVPALVAVLHSNDDLTRANAAATLGTIGDVRAAAALAWMAKSDGYEVAADEAASALAKLDGALDELGISGRSPIAITHGLVRSWVAGDPGIERPYASGQVAWTWADGSLHGEAVLAGLYGLLQAQSALETARDAGAAAVANAGLAAVHATMKAEIETASQLDSLADSEYLASARQRLSSLALALAQAGPGRAQALAMLVGAGQGLAAQALMASMDGSDAELSALRRALSSSDEGVSLAAALALGRLGQDEPAVVSRLARALTGVPNRLAFSIGATGLQGTAPGWDLLSSDEVASGLARVKAFPPKDVVVLEQSAGGVTLDTMVHALTQDARTAGVPIVVVTSSAGEAKTLANRYGDQLAAVVAEGASWADVSAVAGDDSAQRVQAMDRARSAADTLAGLPAGSLGPAGQPAASALSGGAGDQVKVSVLALVTHGVLSPALPAVEELVLSGDGSPELQLAALRAAARLWAARGGAKGDASALREAVSARLGSADSELALAAAHALGQLGMPAAGEVG